MSEELRRQRRSLMVISLVLIFMKYSNLTITKFPLLGGEFTLENEVAVFVLLWLMGFYFGFRYYQYYRQDGLSSLRTAWQSSNNTFFAPKIVDYIKTQYPDELEKSKTI